MTKRLDWLKEEQRKKAKKGKEFDHKWRSGNSPRGEWVSLEDRKNHDGAIEHLSLRHRRFMRRQEIVRKLQLLSERVARNGTRLDSPYGRRVRSEARELIEESRAMELSRTDQHAVANAVRVFELDSDDQAAT